MKKFKIEVDEQVFGFLQAKAVPFVDSPNDVLRRILLKEESRAKVDRPIVRETKSNISFPVVQGDVPKALEHTLQVIYLVKHHYMSRLKATNYLANHHGVASQTILDKYCRQLNLTAHKFDVYLQEKDLSSIKGILERKYPFHSSAIRAYLSQNKSQGAV